MACKEALNSSTNPDSISISLSTNAESAMSDQADHFLGEPIFSYSRAQAIADGVLVDLTTATDDKGQPPCSQAGFKVPGHHQGGVGESDRIRWGMETGR